MQVPCLTNKQRQQIRPTLGAVTRPTIPVSFNYLGPQYQTPEEMASNGPLQRAYIAQEQAAGRMPRTHAEGLQWIAMRKPFAIAQPDGIPTYQGVKTWSGPIPTIYQDNQQPTGDSIPQYTPYSTSTNQEFISGGPITATITLPLPVRNPATINTTPNTGNQTQATPAPASPYAVSAFQTSIYPQTTQPGGQTNSLAPSLPTVSFSSPASANADANSDNPLLSPPVLIAIGVATFLLLKGIK